MRTGIDAGCGARLDSEVLELLGNLYSSVDDQTNFEQAANSIVEYLGIGCSLQLHPALPNDRSEPARSAVQPSSRTAGTSCEPLTTVTAGLMLSHLEQACTIAQTFSNRRRLTASLEDALDRIRFGWVVTNESGRVRYLSGRSHRRFAICGITAALGETLAFSQAADKRGYDAALDAIGSEDLTHRPVRQVVHLQSESAARPALVMFNRIGGAGPWSLLHSEPESIIHFLIDTENLGLSLQLEQVGSESLTATERRVLGLLAEGLSIRSIAARFSRSEFTIRDHVKSIRAKSGNSRQAQLIARLYRNPIWLLSNTSGED